MTIKQIAQDLNLSAGTVSKALNDAPDISETTKTIVCEYAKKPVTATTKPKETELRCFINSCRQNIRTNCFSA